VVAYNGDEIPGSPFAMTSNPNLEDVIDSPRSAQELLAAGKKGDDEGGIFSKNGTGLQRRGSKGRKYA